MRRNFTAEAEKGSRSWETLRADTAAGVQVLRKRYHVASESGFCRWRNRAAKGLSTGFSMSRMRFGEPWQFVDDLENSRMRDGLYYIRVLQL
ncbi:Dynactin Subunit 4 [Manis pentadactyla]|nr:Dynactin Subunit 4 [Manis pentadactyla]